MVVSPEVQRDLTRHTLLCPHCHHLQVIPPQSVGFAVGCRKCHRAFRVTESRAIADVEALRNGDVAAIPAPERSPESRLRAMFDGLRAVLIGVLLLVVVAEAIRQFGSLDVVRAASRRALPVGSMTAPAGDMTGVLARERDGRREAAARYDRRIAAAAGDASAQAFWLDLKRRDLEEVQLLDRQLAREARD